MKKSVKYVKIKRTYGVNLLLRNCYVLHGCVLIGWMRQSILLWVMLIFML
jgi:hypothetical protein